MHTAYLLTGSTDHPDPPALIYPHAGGWRALWADHGRDDYEPGEVPASWDDEWPGATYETVTGPVPPWCPGRDLPAERPVKRHYLDMVRQWYTACAQAQATGALVTYIVLEEYEHGDPGYHWDVQVYDPGTGARVLRVEGPGPSYTPAERRVLPWASALGPGIHVVPREAAQEPA